MKKSAFALLVFAWIHAPSAFATQSTLIAGHGADGCALVKITDAPTNPASARGKCYCKDLAVDQIMLNRAVSCSLFCVGSANAAGQAFTCTAVASLKQVSAGNTKKTGSSGSSYGGGKTTASTGNGSSPSGQKSYSMSEINQFKEVFGNGKGSNGDEGAAGSGASGKSPGVSSDSSSHSGANSVASNSGTLDGSSKPSTTTTSEERYKGLDSDYVGTYRSTLNGDRETAKNNLKEKEDALDDASTRSERKAAKKEVKEAEKAMAKADGEVDILREYRGSYGGKYGGANVETTETVNMGVKTLSGIASQVATNTATNQNNNIMYGIQQQGSAATQRAINHSQADMLDNSAKANQKLGMATVVMSAVQGARIGQHLNSRKKVKNTYEDGMSKANTAWTAAQNDYNTKVAGCNAMMNPAFQARCLQEENQKLAAAKDLYQSQKENALNNKSGELDAQNSIATKQTIETATTAAQAALMLAQANSLKKAANAIRNQPVSDVTNPFTFNPGAVAPNPTPDSNPITNDPGTVVADEDIPTTDLAGNDMMNPNIADPGPGGPAAGAFNSSRPEGAGGGGGVGMGSAGGTSAAKDDGKPETAALAKTESGKYSAGEAVGGSRFARGAGNGGGVGVDSGFADLLKKFLPGGEEDKKQNHDLAFDNDRTPASDQAAVLGRNQNIFEAIHKRYQKKHNEGAIVFVGDRG